MGEVVSKATNREEKKRINKTEKKGINTNRGDMTAAGSRRGGNGGMEA